MNVEKLHQPKNRMRTVRLPSLCNRHWWCTPDYRRGSDEALLKIGSLSSTFRHLIPSRYRSFEDSSRINYNACEGKRGKKSPTSAATLITLNYTSGLLICNTITAVYWRVTGLQQAWLRKFIPPRSQLLSREFFRHFLKTPKLCCSSYQCCC